MAVKLRWEPGIRDKLEKEWFDGNEKNIDDYSPGSGYKAGWVCEKGHEWNATINDRVHGGGCPYCSGRRVLCGFNDLQTTRPDIAASWSEKNEDKRPSDVMPMSNKKAWWHCDKCGQDWQASPNSRCNGQGCPYCAGKRVIKGVNDLQTLYPDLIDQQWDFAKNKILPSDLTKGSSRRVWWHCPVCGNEWQASVYVRTAGCGCPECKKMPWDLDVLERLSKEWSPANEKPITAYSPGSEYMAEWICDKGHVWTGIIGNRARKGYNCPYCSGHRLLRGLNDLQTVRPDIAASWSEKNEDKRPSDVMPMSNKKAWWHCDKCGQDWQATPNSRCSGKGCPYCSGNYVTKGVNDLQTVRPDVASEWAYELNNGKTPADVKWASSLKCWWRCNTCGHEWKAAICDRTSGQQSGCPVCNHKVPGKNSNNLASDFPSIAAEFDVSRNEGNASDYLPKSNKFVWWICPNGHSYRMTITNRTTRGTGCPYCAGKKVLVGFNDLATTDPAIAAQMDCEKSGFTPQEVVRGSGKYAYWICPQGHSFRTTILCRTNGTECPICSGKRMHRAG